MRHIVLTIAMMLAVCSQAKNVNVTIYANNCDSANVISCPIGQQLRITAEATLDGSKFAKWSDGNTDNPRLITATQNCTFTAYFKDSNPIKTWTGGSTAWTKGSGTEGDPYLIETPEQLAYLSNQVNQGVSEYNGIYFLQTASFNMESLLFRPIGAQSKVFKGNYDGGNHSIANLYLDASNNDCLALFGHVDGSKISNMTITGTVSSNGETRRKAGLICFGKNITLINCANEADITHNGISISIGGDHGFTVGGLVAVCEGGICTFEKCSNKGNISVPVSQFGDPNAGGILGYAFESCQSCIFKECSNSGTIFSTSTSASSAGIAANVSSSSFSFYRCKNTGAISAVSTSSWLAVAGGIAAGVGGSGSFIECANVGNILTTASNYETRTSGIVCYGDKAHILNCYSRGSIKSNGSYQYAAGLGGNNCTIKNSYFAGTLSASTSYSITAGTAENSYYNTDCGATKLQGTAKTTAELKSADMVALLNKDSIVWAIDSKNENDGYPVLKWMNPTPIFDPDHPLNPGKYNVKATASPVEGGIIRGKGEYSQGAKATLSAFANTGYTFIAWSDGETSATRSFTMPAHDTAFVANFKINSYLITFNNYDGELLQSDSLTYGSTPQFKGKTPTKPATAQWTYTFKEWTPAIAQVTGDATYTATYDSTLVSYLVTFNNYDGTELQSSNVNYGTMPQYTGTTPEKPSTKHWSYTFKTWNPQLVTVTQAATYTATYDSTLIALDTVIVTDEQNISDLAVGDITHIIVRETGKLTVDEPTEALSLTLYQTNTASAQVVNVSNLTVATADMVLRLEPKAEQATLAKWYAFGVPFEVEVASGIAKEGASSKAQSGYDFVIDNYDGALRATTQQGWKRCQTSDVLQQGKFYMIAVNGTQNLWRFTKKASAAITEQTSLSVSQNTATSANHSGWNGLSNSLLQSAMASMQGLTYATVYRNATSTYETVVLAQSALDASHPFFVQVAKSGTILLSEATTNAPARMLAATTIDDNPIYTIAFKSETNKDTDKETYTDKAYLSLSETKAKEYTIGLDVEKMQANTTSQPQLWLEAYGMQLAAHEATIAEQSTTTIPVGLYAPADGEFTLTTTTTTTTTFALLNKGSEVEPKAIDEEANTATWTLYLTKGTNLDYALQIGQRGIGTGVQNAEGTMQNVEKVMIDGVLYIKRAGKIYNAQGGEVR